MDDATAKFQLALPYALLPISPSLSALHSLRVRSSDNACRQCGCAMHRGESSVRTIRMKASRAIQTTCLVCGWVQTLPVARGNAALFPRTRKGGARSSNVVEEATIVPDEKPLPTPVKEPSKNPPILHQPGPAIVVAPPLPKSRPKKKGGLQSMLERNKERQSKEKSTGSGPGGLAMFLNNL